MTSADFQDLTILFADDNNGDQILVQHALRELPWEINLITVPNGVAMMDYLRRRGEFARLDPSIRPDLILLDLRMPEKNGVETLMDIRADATLSELPIYVLTGVKPTGPLIDFLGDTPYIPKPNDFNELVEFLQRTLKPIVERHRADQPLVSESREASSEDFNILFADDCIADQNLVRLAMSELGLNINLKAVEDGQAALDYLHRQGDYASDRSALRPDLILMDLWMPGKTGFETIREIKGSPELEEIPIIVLSSGDPGLSSHFHAGEAIGFFQKPDDFQDLVRLLDNLLVGRFQLKPSLQM